MSKIGFAFQRNAILIVVACLLSGPTFAQSCYTSLVAFGDGLTDSGNTENFFEIPLLPYVSGRLTNGPNWLDELAGSLNLSSGNSLDGGSNYAWAGSRTGPVGNALPPPSLLDQAGFYLVDSGAVADPNALYVVWGGANDVRDLDSADAASNIAAIISDLATAGAARFLVPNVFDIGLTPESQAGGNAAAISTATVAHNLALAAELSALSSTLPDINIMALDVFAAVNQALSGFDNVTDPCWDGDFMGGGTQCATPVDYFFWDRANPTTAVHEIIGDAAFELVVDTDGDCDPDATDPDDDDDGIGDALDPEPLVPGNLCADLPDDATLDTTVSSALTCAARDSIDVLGTTQVVDPEGHLQLISPVTRFRSGFSAAGQLTVISADPCPGCESGPEPSNDPPVANNDNYSVVKNATLIIPAQGVLQNDTDPNADTLFATLNDGVSSGTLSLGAEGSLSYTPGRDFVGMDAFTYKASDSVNDSNIGVVTIDVEDAALNIEVPNVIGESIATDIAGGDQSWTKPADFGDEVAVYVDRVSMTADSIVSIPSALPGQVIVDPAQSEWLLYNGNGPLFVAGLGYPEGFLYRGDRQPDGTRAGGDQSDIIEALAGSGANGLYIMAVRSNGGDGEETENPFIDSDSALGLDEDILHQWDLWLGELDANGIVTTFFFYDDGSKIWNTGDTVGIDEQAFVEALVNRFEHYKNIVWCIAEEYSEAYSAVRVSNIAAVVRAADDFDHPIAVHKLGGLEFEEFADDPNIDQFGIQFTTSAPASAFHENILTAFQNADGRYNLNMMENGDHGTGALARQYNWAAAMAGSYVLVYGLDEVMPAATDLFELGVLARFMERTAIDRLRPNDSLALAGTEFVLAEPGSKYIAYKSTPGSDLLGLKELPAGLYQFRWVDTVTGAEVLMPAQATIEAAGLRVGSVVGQYSSSIPMGEVIAQDPSPGVMLESGSRVNVVVSLGPE